MAEYIEREAVLAQKFKIPIENLWHFHEEKEVVLAEDIKAIHAADVRPVPDGGIGEMSDGYHTFNGLYYQRMVLFAALVKAYKDKAWKSWKHEDGKPCFDGGWFIVGIDTPQGSYTYHYEDKYWNWFDCEELPVAKHWDGHTEEDVTRLLSLDVQPVVRGKWIDRDDDYYGWNMWACSACGEEFVLTDGTPDMNEYHFCPNCGADMREKS
jgi:hypothetical protein